MATAAATDPHLDPGEPGRRHQGSTQPLGPPIELSAPLSISSDDARQKPTPLSIPLHTADRPLFSAYPIQHDSAAPAPAATTALAATASPDSYAPSTWPRRRPDKSGSKNAMKRRSRSPPPPLPDAAAWTMNVARRHSIATPSPTKQSRSSAAVHSPSRGRTHHQRRASLSSGELDATRWRPAPYPDPHHTPESDTDCVPVPPRRSSLAHHESVILGLSSLSLSTSKDATTTDGLTKSIIYESDHHLPPDTDHHHHHHHHQLPPADSMLLIASDAASFISDPSQFSPSGTSKSLPSTKTSLSRSARSGREGSGDIDVDLASGQQPQQSKVQLDKRRMILLEIVETEVTYVRDLRALVHIYLPQLAALPHVSERIHQLIVRNTAELLDFHIGLVGHMVDILKFSGLSYESSDAHTIDTVTKGLADLFVSEGTSFALYNDYCAGSTAAAALVRTIAHRSDYEAFEKRCQIISSSAPHATLLDILTNQQSTPLGSRLRFRDILITPVQRVCRYPLLLASLLADVNRDQPMSDVVAAVEAAQVSMRAVAENADDARRRKEAELKTATVADRIETHSVLTRNFLGRLGTCRLIGALDVLYHHNADSKVRYLAAFLYCGYIILAKVQKARGTFEPKHYLPLEVFELADIKKGENVPRGSALTSGILPHTIRMSARDHHFDLAASCETEKDVWMAEMTAARNESTVPPFELPSSVALYSIRSRHSSTVIAERPPQLPPVIKRHTVFGLEELSIVEPASPEDSCFASPEEAEPERPQTPPGYRRLQSGEVLLRRTSMSQRLLIDRALIDVMSETLSTARSRAMAQAIPDNVPLRRQRSIASLADLMSSPELRSVLLPNRTRSRSAVRASRLVVGDSGVLIQVDGEAGDLSRNNSFASLTDAPPKRHSSVSLRRGVEAMTPSRVVLHRKSTSLSGTGRPVFTLNRASSLPSSPAAEVKVIRDDGSDRAPTDAADAEQTELLEDDDDKTDAKSDGDFVIVPDNLPEPAPQHTPKRASTLKRSLSFFARKGLTPLDTLELPQDFGPRSAGSSGGSPHLTVASAPSTPFGSPQPLKRRRSVRLFGQLRGFTPI